MSLILASQSRTRAEMLRAAGVEIEIRPARIDEAAVKAAMLAEGAAPRDIADMLAGLKARRVGAGAPGRLVLGADQVLVCEGRLYDKPVDPAGAREQLLSLRGRTHQLLSAAVICEGEAPVWRHIGTARLVVRPFTEAFLSRYLAEAGEALTGCVGAYRLEGIGAQLFARVDGDHFSVLGLPLLEVLGFLRARGVLVD